MKRPSDSLAAFRNYFPALPRNDLRRALAALLHTSEKRLDTVLAEVGDEFAVHMAMSTPLRENLYVHAGCLSAGG